MFYLLIASVVWAFSFGLIKHKLVGVGMDPWLVAFVRLSLSLLVFLPFLRRKGVGRAMAGRLMAIGAVQYGLMYLAYLSSYRFLAAHEVALFTIFTPLYVTLVNDLCIRRFHRLFLLTALLAVAGTAVIVLGNRGEIGGTLVGFLILQVANICFALGQVAYRRVMSAPYADGGAQETGQDVHVFAWLYLGAVLITAAPLLVSGTWRACNVQPGQLLTLLYLGIVPSGVCFFLWNVGARKTNAGTLAVFNNAKIPLAVLCALLLFGETANIPRLIIGGLVILVAVIVNQKEGAR